jgi:uncharacterized protein (DUF1499 family)
MKKMMFWLIAAPLLLALLLLVAGQAGLLQGSAPSNLGVRDGRLKPPSKTPNSVTSQADLWPDAPQRKYASIAPLALRGGDGPATIAALRAIVQAWPGAEVVEARPDYLYARFGTRWLRFVDDVEFWFDPAAQVVQVRSASRIGYGDWGLNRKRVEALRQQLAATGA